MHVSFESDEERIGKQAENHWPWPPVWVSAALTRFGRIVSSIEAVWKVHTASGFCGDHRQSFARSTLVLWTSAASFLLFFFPLDATLFFFALDRSCRLLERRWHHSLRTGRLSFRWIKTVESTCCELPLLSKGSPWIMRLISYSWGVNRMFRSDRE